jgi:mono/diheme cytochrome c family protein
MRTWLIVAGVALLVAIAAIGGWLLGRRGQAPAYAVSQTAQAGDLRITVLLDAAALGEREIEIVVQDAAGNPADVQSVRLRFGMAEMDMGMSESEAQPRGQGRYHARGPFFTMVGDWNVDATIERTGQPATHAAFVFPVAAPGEQGGPSNPLLADAATLAAGRSLYAANCAACHGADGKGDGPLAAGLNPRPANFSQHMIPGKHTDGQVFLWIKDGFPGTAMPAWGLRLSDEQIWQLVIALRSFGRPETAASGAATAPVATGATPGDAAAVAPTAPGQASELREPLPPLVFVRAGNIWRSSGGAAPPRKLTDLPADVYPEQPVVSPDGTQIAFLTRSPGPLTATLPISITTLALMPAGGGDVRALWQPPRGLLALPTWTADGQAIYVGFNDVLSDPSAPVVERVVEIVRVDMATGERRQVLEDARDPTISRDGARMAYVRYDPDNAAYSVHVAAPDGSADRQVIAASAFSDFYAPRFSPDGKQLVVAAIGGPVTDDQGYPLAVAPSSPLGGLLSWLAPPAAEAHGALWDLWVVNVDGSGLRRLPLAREDTPMAAFSPDGRQIAMMGAGGIYLMDADGAKLRRIDPAGDHGGLDWPRE